MIFACCSHLIRNTLCIYNHLTSEFKCYLEMHVCCILILVPIGRDQMSICLSMLHDMLNTIRRRQTRFCKVQWQRSLHYRSQVSFKVRTELSRGIHAHQCHAGTTRSAFKWNWVSITRDWNSHTLLIAFHSKGIVYTSMLWLRLYKIIIKKYGGVVREMGRAKAWKLQNILSSQQFLHPVLLHSIVHLHRFLVRLNYFQE